MEHGNQPLIIFCPSLLTTLFTLILTQLLLLKTEQFAVIYHHHDSQGFFNKQGFVMLI